MTRLGKPAGVWRKWLVRAGVSAAILSVFFWFLPVDQVIDGISGVPLWLFLSVFVLFLLGHVAAAAKWWLLIGRVVDFPVALRAHFAGLAANLCLPGVAGGDAARMALAWTGAKDRARLAAGSFSDRLIDLMGLGCLALMGLALSNPDGDYVAATVEALLLVAALFAAFVWGIPRVLPSLWAAVPRLPARDFVARACAAMIELGRRPLFITSILALSMAIQGSFILLSLQLAQAAGLAVGVAAWAFAWSLAKLIVVLPISLGGLGVREAALAGLLAPFGAATPVVLASGLVWQAVLFLAGGVGALVLTLTGGGLRIARPALETGDKT